MSGATKLTPAQDRILRLAAAHGMLRRVGGNTAQHWIPAVTACHPGPVARLFDLRFLRVVSLGVRDVIEVSDLGRAYLAGHPEKQA